MAQWPLNLTFVTAASLPRASATGTYPHEVPPLFEKSTLSVVLAGPEYARVSPDVDWTKEG